MASTYPLLKEVLLADGGVQFILYHLLQTINIMVCSFKGELGSSLLAIYNKKKNPNQNGKSLWHH